MKQRILPLILVILLLSGTIGAVAVTESSDADTYTDSEFLIDYGNGDTKWIPLVSKGTVTATISASLSNSSVPCTLDGEDTVIDGVGKTTIGSDTTGGSYSVPGTTGIKVTSYWHPFVWDSGLEKWIAAEYSDSFTQSAVAIAFYPDGMIPVETPLFKSSWTSLTADAENSANQTASISSEEPSVKWSYKPKMGVDSTASYGAVLYAQGHAIVKYGYGDNTKHGAVVSYDMETGTEEWRFRYPVNSYETPSPLIAGQYVFVQASSGKIYYFNWETGPGTNNVNVRNLDNTAWDSDIVLPTHTVAVKGNAWGSGPTNMVFDSGCIFVKHSNGMVYCFNTNLQLVWSFQTEGNTYYTQPTVHGDYVATGMYDGHLYVLDKHDGSFICKQLVYVNSGTTNGQINIPLFMENLDGCTIFITYSSGGMSAYTYGLAIYRLSAGTLTEVKNYQNEFGALSNGVARYKDVGAILSTKNGTQLVKTNGDYSLISDTIKGVEESHAIPTLVNDNVMFFSTYSSHKLFEIDMEGRVLGSLDQPISAYCMAPVTVVDNYIIGGNDSGAFGFGGGFAPYVPPSEVEKTDNWQYLAYGIAIVVVSLSVLWAVLKFGLKWDKPFLNLKSNLYFFIYGETYTHNTRSRHKLWLVMLIGLTLTFIAALMSLCLGAHTTLNPFEAIGYAISSISKGGKGLTYEELIIYNSRLPRTLAAIAVGIGLSVAGAVYQAIIKNPLVEPYIMGVSSGAGTLAVAVIAFDFTFFGLLPQNSPYMTAVSAILGGLLAFALTMYLANKTGGKSTNYVLAGIIIGLVFSAIQSLMMIRAGNNMASALSWLYGSFSSMTWGKLWFVFIPAITLSLIPLVWAKELNLVLLGNDQARLMGLNVDVFNKWMLIIVSILTAFCVAFCGIIGFVGLVIPHLCRMIVGGDHRLMLPAAMAFGGFLLVMSDLMARFLLTGYELPIGAITTVIGVPMFAYLLIKRGRSYDV